MPHYAFLAEGAFATLSEFSWPTPDGYRAGPWVEAGVEAPRAAIRACTVDDLPWWLDDELWELELDGDVEVQGRCVLARRGRLVRRIEAWDDGVAERFVEACARRVHDAADDARRRGDESGAAALDGFAEDVVLYAGQAARPAAAAGVGAYVAAHGLAGGDQGVRTYARRFEDERRWQVEWLRERLRL
jgi:hypothetical protein